MESAGTQSQARAILVPAIILIAVSFRMDRQKISVGISPILTWPAQEG
jgi:hypothetical protein